jgi:multidrug efflux pump subunit AcrB
MPRLFIDRPVLATVISVVITLMGGLAIFSLPIAQYPEVVPPQVRVTAAYRGANAQDVEKTVAAPIEQQLFGLDDLLYLSSSSSNDGVLTITLTFEVGTDLDLAAVQVQNKVALAEPTLPEEVRREGVTVTKVSSATLQFVSVYSPNGRYDDLFLSNYVKVSLLDRLASLPGVGGASLPGEREYAMRIWLNPDKLATLGLTAADVRTAVDSQNQPPEPRGSGRPAASPPRRRTSIPGECPRAPP